MGDVGVVADKIAAISNRDGSDRLSGSQAKRVIDCTGRIVSPGWVDIHTHLDAQITWDSFVTPLSGGGVTTAVQGNCGVGFAPCKIEDREFLLELMEGVEDIPLGSMVAGIKWEWETFPQYMEAMSKKNLAIDVGTMIGHGPVRAFVMGRRANLSDKPGGHQHPVEEQDMEAMAKVVGEAIRAGALGFSTSRTLLHRDRSGTLVPGTLATDQELLLIGKAIGQAGKGKAVFEMASDFQCIDDVAYTADNHKERLTHFGREFIWMKTMSKQFGVPLCFCLGMPSAAGAIANGFRQMLRNVETANAEGCNMSVQVFTRPQGILMCWDSKSHPFTNCPSFDALWRVGRDQAGWFKGKNRLWKDPALREKIVQEALALAQGSNDSGNFGIVLPQSTDEDGPGNLNATLTSKGALAKMYLDNARFVFRFTNTYEPAPDTSAEVEAKQKNTTAMHIIYDWLCEQNGTQVVTHMFMQFAKMNLDDCYEMLMNPYTAPGLGDTGAHLGFLSDPTSPSYLLAHWHRDRTSGPRISLENAVKLHSLDTAKVFGLSDRGTLQIGKMADVNVIDLEKLIIHTPRFVRDLPKGAPRWVQDVSGYNYTIKSGTITYENGKPTGLLPGRFLRGPGYEAIGEVALAPVTVGTEGFGLTILKIKWEVEQKFLEGLLAVLGPERLEKVGAFINERMPLRASKL